MPLLKLVSDVLLKPYFDEKLRALKYDRYFKYAVRLLAENDVDRACQGLAVLAELARTYAYRTQEVISAICDFLKRRWAKSQPFDASWNRALVAGLRILSALPKKDSNEHPYYVEVTQIRAQELELKGINFENFVLWGTDFIDVNMTRSNFRNTDLGGCRFLHGTSVEWSDFSEAMMNFSFVDEIATTFDGARLWGADFSEARIDCCNMVISDGFDAQPIAAKFGDKLVVVNARP